MNSEPWEIRRVRREELSLIRDIAPVEWDLDIEAVYRRHLHKDYFYPVVATLNSLIAGTGMAMLHDNCTWLGTIIVRKEYRNRGIGTAITNHLIKQSLSRQIETIILAASEMGEPIYIKMGFKPDISYLAFRIDNNLRIESYSNNIQRINLHDYDAIFALDFKNTGEIRTKILGEALRNGYKYEVSAIDGYFLPDFGTGLIIADNETAGLELLKFKLSKNFSNIVVPETNISAIEYLTSLGFNQSHKTLRMFLNDNVRWDSNKVYARGCGYLG